MKRDRRAVNSRHADILALLRQKREVKVEELAKTFDVSLMTIRRDLKQLEEQGYISRTHGGATTELRGQPAEERDQVALYRQLIARYAASLVKDGERLFVSGSTTALGVLDHLTGKSVTVITNNGAAVGRAYPPGVDIILLGGLLRSRGHIMTGDYAMRNLLLAQADKAFIGCNGISPEGEVLYGVPTAIGINETMMGHAQEYFILADHTKIGKTGTYASCSLEKRGVIVTDELAPADVVERLRSVGMTVIQVRQEDFLEPYGTTGEADLS